jgi:hypothetical protein
MRQWLVLAAVLVLPGLAGCKHTEPVGGPGPPDHDQPFDPTPPVRLTFNLGQDRRAAWLPDGSGILYSTEPPGSDDNDICLALLPPTGGRQRSLICELSSPGQTLTEAIESAAPAADGRLAFVAAASSVEARLPIRQGLAYGSLADPAAHTILVEIPYTIPGKRTHSGVSQVRWQDSTRLLYLGEAVNVMRPCDICEMDTLRSGLDAVTLRVDGSGAIPQAIPGTDNASGVSPGGDEDEVYYTLGGDTRVYRQRLSTGEVALVYDFGAAGIARDVHVVGSRMAAVVGGRVHFIIDDPRFGSTQWDSGGIVHVVNFQDGNDLMIQGPATPGLFRRPQLSPTGAALVAELYPLIITEIPGLPTDTSVSRLADLYLFGQP